ncbi:MAG: ComEC/Rec2 family competence protein [Acidimicrobiales bacterium]
MPQPVPLPAGSFADDDFVASIDRNDLVYVCCNVGDADAQVVLLPEDHGGMRRAIVVDAGRRDKVVDLLRAFGDAGLLALNGAGGNGANGDGDGAASAFPIALVIGTHPHQDHIAGMPQVLREFSGQIAEYWDPGYYHTLQAYTKVMREIENQPRLVYANPTSGLQRWFGRASVTVLSPAIQLRNRFDTYGVEINDSSISLRIEAPATRVRMDGSRRTYVSDPDSAVLVLGADAQTLSWSYVMADFPYLVKSESPIAKALRAAGGDWDALKADVFKVSHHCSKHGISLELVERMSPAVTIVSCDAAGGKYNFPHSVSQELLREALHPSTSSGQPHPVDHELGIFYTFDHDSDQEPCGSIAVVARSKRRRRLWRFTDGAEDPIDFAKARRWAPA